MNYNIDTEAINFEYLEELPTLSQGQASDLKCDSPNIRLWLTRTGYVGIRQASIEVYTGQAWITLIEITQLLEGGEWIDCSSDVL